MVRFIGISGVSGAPKLRAVGNMDSTRSGQEAKESVGATTGQKTPTVTMLKWLSRDEGQGQVQGAKRQKEITPPITQTASEVEQELERSRAQVAKLEQAPAETREKYVAALKQMRQMNTKIGEMKDAHELEIAELEGARRALKELAIEAVTNQVIAEKVKLQVDNNMDLVKVIQQP